MTASLVYGLLRLLPYGLPRNDAGRERMDCFALGLAKAQSDDVKNGEEDFISHNKKRPAYKCRSESCFSIKVGIDLGKKRLFINFVDFRRC